MNKPRKIRLHVLSPVHIGCDDVFEPTSFVIDEENKKLIEFDPLDFVDKLDNKQRTEFLKVCSGDNLLSIMKFIKNNCKNIKGREVDIVPELIKHYKTVLALPTFDKKAKEKVINRFTMNKTAYNPHTGQQYIPGTSLKGSMRTAYLSALANVRNITKWKGKSDELETELLRRSVGKEKMSSDPFRMVKVSDLLPVGDVKTKIVYAVNKKKEKSDKESMANNGEVYQIFETIQPGAVFEGTININMPEQTAGIRYPITMGNLTSSLNKFYVPLLETEIKILKSIGISAPIINYTNAKFRGQINKTVFIIRIGRHSGAEAVTIEGNRYIYIKHKNKRPKYLDHSTTIWLASESLKLKNNTELLPFGWAALEEVS